MRKLLYVIVAGLTVLLTHTAGAQSFSIAHSNVRYVAPENIVGDVVITNTQSDMSNFTTVLREYRFAGDTALVDHQYYPDNIGSVTVTVTFPIQFTGLYFFETQGNCGQHVIEGVSSVIDLGSTVNVPVLQTVARDANVDVYNLNGKKVFQYKITSSKVLPLAHEISGYVPGMYVLRITKHGSHFATKKIIL